MNVLQYSICFVWSLMISLDIKCLQYVVHGHTHLNKTTLRNTTYELESFVQCMRTTEQDEEQRVIEERMIYETQLKLLNRYNHHGGLVVTDNLLYKNENENGRFQVIYTSPYDLSTFNLKNIVITLKDSGISSYVISCSVKCTMEILKFATILNLTSEEFVWILRNKEMELLSPNLPSNTLLVESVDILKTEAQGSKTLRSCERIPNLTRVKTFYNSFWKTVAIYTADNMKLTYLPKSNLYLHKFPLPYTQHQHHHLRIVSIAENPFTIILENSDELYNPVSNECLIGRTCWQTIIKNGTKTQKPLCCVGYCIDLLNELEHDLNFQSHLYLVEDSTYGQIKNGTWVGMVGDLVYDKADLILAPLTINTKRAQYIDYSYPFMISGLAIVTIIRETEISFFNIEAFKPLSLELWSGIIALTFFVSFLLLLMENRFYLPYTRNMYIWRESITYVMGLLFQRDIGGMNPRLASSRICAIAVATGVMIIMSTYTAVLTANNVTHEKKLPITGFNDRKLTNPTHNFKFGTLEDSTFTQMFADSNDPNWNHMNQFMKYYNFKSSTKAFERLVNGELDAVLNDYYISLYYMVKDPQCRMQFAGDIIKEPGYGLATQKGSIIAEEISRKIQIYKDYGILNSMESKWIPSRCSLSKNEVNAVKIGIRYFGGLLSLLIGSCCIVGFICLLEVLVGRYNAT